MTAKANEHHLVMGELEDMLSGQMLPDTHDERYRQKICALILNQKKFKKNEVQGRFEHILKAGDLTARIYIDFLIQYKDKIVILIKYAPGSLVTRRLSTLALSRTIAPYQIPIVVVTNGEDAEIIDGQTGKVMSTGFEGMPDREYVIDHFSQYPFNTISASVLEQASRIAFACEVNGACPCDTDVCILENQ